jgi:class 3 adenylate cyclase
MSDTEAPAASSQDLERRLATILCADVAGYSRLMGEDEERTVRVFRGHREIFEALVAQHRGRIFNTAGDALLAEFSSAVEAVRCATDIQAALRTRNEHLAPEERMQFRIGINLGDVIVQGGDLLGDGVNVAARIQQGTEPGGICISGSVYEQIQNKLSLDFKLLGEMPYKNISKPIRTYTINEGAAITAPARKVRPAIAGGIAAAVAALAAAGWWGYGQLEEQRAEKARVQAELEAQRKVASDAQHAAEEAKREAQLQAQTQIAQDALRRAQEERNRVEQDRKLLETERKAAESAKAAAPAIATKFDGTYDGRICNQVRDKAPTCWPVVLVVREGVAQGGWVSPNSKRTATVNGAIASDGAVHVNLAAFTPKGEATEAQLAGQVASGEITAAGKWGWGGTVTAEWHHAAALVPAAASKKAPGAARYDGTYNGRLCNHLPDDHKRCWNADLVVRKGVVEASWLSRTKNTATAHGTIGDDGTVRLTLNAWNPRGDPTDAQIEGRVAGETVDASGKWSDGTAVTGKWLRAP